MTQHTLKYIHERRGFCKAEKIPEKEPEPEQPKPTMTNDIVNQYIQEHPEIASTYLRKERSMKAPRKQMHVRTFLKCDLIIVLF